MNLTLKKYELMKRLGIELNGYPLKECLKHKTKRWWEGDRTITDFAVASMLERACREWLEEQE